MTDLELKDGNGDTMLVAEVEGHYMLRGCTEQWRKANREAPIRQDDVFICGYPKTGHHWVWEMVKMLVTGNIDHVNVAMEHFSLENPYLTPQTMEKMESPRVLTFHGFLSELPREALDKRCKVIYLQRGVKDVAVSHFKMVSELVAFDYEGNWSGFCSAFLEGQVPFGSWFRHSAEWRNGLQSRPDFPVHVVRFEDTKADPAKTIRKLADFLEVKVSESEVESIQRLTEFKTMKKFKSSIDAIYTLPEVSKSAQDVMYRKGTVGDWRHWFTVAQSEAFDRKLAETGLDKDLQV